MKTRIGFLRIDVLCQDILLGLNTLLVIVAFIESRLFFFLLTLQFLIYAYQFLISAIFNLYLMPGKDDQINLYRKLHLVASPVYVVLMIFFVLINPHPVLDLVLLAVIPQLIAYAYWGLSHLDYSARRHYIRNREAFQLR